MKNKIILSAIIILILVAGGIYFYLLNTESEPNIKPGDYSEVTYEVCTQELINKGVPNSDFSECEKYIDTRNAKIEKGIRDIVNLEIENQKQNNIMISIAEIMVLNKDRESKGIITLDCTKDLDYETEEEIIRNIAEKLFEIYPEEYSKDTIKHSLVRIDFDCVDSGSWGISNGHYGTPDYSMTI